MRQLHTRYLASQRAAYTSNMPPRFVLSCSYKSIVSLPSRYSHEHRDRCVQQAKPSAESRLRLVVRMTVECSSGPHHETATVSAAHSPSHTVFRHRRLTTPSAVLIVYLCPRSFWAVPFLHLKHSVPHHFSTQVQYSPASPAQRTATAAPNSRVLHPGPLRIPTLIVVKMHRLVILVICRSCLSLPYSERSCSACVSRARLVLANI
jgi:hypothetical protein